MPTECYCSMGKTGRLSEHANGRMNLNEWQGQSVRGMPKRSHCERNRQRKLCRRQEASVYLKESD